MEDDTTLQAVHPSHARRRRSFAMTRTLAHAPLCAKQAASPSDAALRRQLERHVGMQKARLLALATGQEEPAQHPAPVTPAASPLPAPDDCGVSEPSGHSGRCHSH